MDIVSLYPVVNSLDVGRGMPPTEIKLFPLGLVKSRKGNFLVDAEAYNSIVNHFKAHNVDIPIDYEHQTLQDVQAPAAGWIKDLTMKSDGVYATVEWTDKATQYLAAKEYRYLSPVVNVRESDRKALMLHSVALTNAPAIDGMTAIVNSEKAGSLPADETREKGGDPLTQQAEPNDIASFIKRLCNMLQLPDDATLYDIERLISELLQGQTELKMEVNSLKFEAHKNEAEKAVNEALQTGKITPYQRERAFGLALSHLEIFKDWTANAPQIVPMGEFAPEPLILKDKSSRSHVQRLLGLSDDDLRRYGGEQHTT